MYFDELDSLLVHFKINFTFNSFERDRRRRLQEALGREEQISVPETVGPRRRQPRDRQRGFLRLHGRRIQPELPG